MPIFKLNKLVRNKIPEDQRALGEIPRVRKLTRGEHRKELLRKIIEEAQEHLNVIEEMSDQPDTDPAKRLGEIPDIKQAYDDLIALEGLSEDEIAEAQRKKAAKSGTFSQGLFIDTVETSENDSWTKYYRKAPDRYPEIG